MSSSSFSAADLCPLEILESILGRLIIADPVHFYRCRAVNTKWRQAVDRMLRQRGHALFNEIPKEIRTTRDGEPMGAVVREFLFLQRSNTDWDFSGRTDKKAALSGDFIYPLCTRADAGRYTHPGFVQPVVCGGNFSGVMSALGGNLFKAAQHLNLLVVATTNGRVAGYRSDRGWGGATLKDYDLTKPEWVKEHSPPMNLQDERPLAEFVWDDSSETIVVRYEFCANVYEYELTAE